MIAMTQAGSEECGSPGDFLSWEEAKWHLTSRARKLMVGELEGPCRMESTLHVYAVNFKYHGAATNGDKVSGCMEHCHKIGRGRSPPVRTLEELETLQAELSALTPNLAALPWLWLYHRPEAGGGLAGLLHWGEAGGLPHALVSRP